VLTPLNTTTSPLGFFEPQSTTPSMSGTSLTPYLFHEYGQGPYVLYYPRRYYGYGARYYGVRTSPTYFAELKRLTKLTNDLESLTMGTAAPSTTVDQLQSDLMGIVYRTEKPPPAADVRQLVADLAAILPSRQIPWLNTAQMARDLEAVMNAGRYTGPGIEQAMDTIRSNLIAAGVDISGVRQLTHDLREVTDWDEPRNPRQARVP